jgi:hypothetical protein
MNRTPDKTGLSVASQRLDNITPNILVKSLWVSTALALIFVIPPLGIIIAVVQNTGNILIGSLIGFGLHFILLSVSGKMSSFLTSLFDY